MLCCAAGAPTQDNTPLLANYSDTPASLKSQAEAAAAANTHDPPYLRVPITSRPVQVRVIFFLFLINYLRKPVSFFYFLINIII